MQKHPETFWEWGGTDVDICAYLNERLSAGESDGVLLDDGADAMARGAAAADRVAASVRGGNAGGGS
eukprot:ctg_2535.g450